MPKLTIDGQDIEVAAGMTVIQACEQAGIEIPRFCYHERLSIAGNCRMCLVEMEKAPKLIAACAMPVGEGMVIHTASDKVKKARQGVMEFLLVNHPLDCPICDQGGECDLQDQAMAYGMGHGRYHETKRAVVDKDFGPLVKGIMTRCIHCTRCVRFAEQVAGMPVLGGIGRGEHMEISTYVGQAINSELSGNLVDLCPVGALTSAPYAFTARPWELRKTPSIDVFDAAGSAIRVDTRGSEVMRVLPRLNEDINGEWIGDKSRHAIDGLRVQRLDRPYVRRNGKLTPATWDQAFAAIAQALNGLSGEHMAALAGDMVDCEAMVALKDLMTALGSANMDCRQDGAALDAKVRASYLFNSTIAAIDEADAILLVGCNPRWEAPVINARIRARWRDGGLQVGVIGEALDLTYDYQHLGEGPQALAELAEGEGAFAAVLKTAQNPLMILGMGALARGDGNAVLGLAQRAAVACQVVRDKTWNGFNVLHTAAARVGGLDLGFVPAKGGLNRDKIVAAAKDGTLKAVYLLAADELPMDAFKETFVIYQGHHGDAGAQIADVVLPGAAPFEKSGTWVNTEGRVQRGQGAIRPPGDAREDWAIIRALSAVLGHALPYDTLAQVRQRLVETNASFAAVDEIKAATWKAFGGKSKATAEPFRSVIANYYMTDPISRCSVTMAACSEAFVLGTAGKTGTHG